MLRKIRSHLGETIQNLNQAISAKENFLALMSHEIRTPLHGINLAAENIMEVDSDQDKLEMAEIITSSSKHLKGIIDDILDFSKLNKDKVKIERIYIDLEDFLTRIQLDYGNQAKRLGLEFVIDRDESLKGIVSDPIRLEQILRNLLSNAFKFTDNGKIELLISLADSQPSSFQIIVIDTGRGISPDRLTTILKNLSRKALRSLKPMEDRIRIGHC
jgi:signal transduction histidine kinase